MLENWWNHNVYLDGLIHCAVELERGYPGERCISVGQSAAWIVHTLGQLREAYSCPADVATIAFTGAFMQGQEGQSDYSVDIAAYPTGRRLRDYFGYMARTQTRAQDIVRHYEQTGQRTVFVDAVSSGRGFASFMHIWLKTMDAAQTPAQKEAITRAICFHAYAWDWPENADNRFHIEMDRDETVSVAVRLDYGAGVDMTLVIAGAKGEKDAHQASDRLVPCFDISAGGSGHLKPAGNDMMVQAIKSTIGRYVGARVTTARMKQGAKQRACAVA